MVHTVWTTLIPFLPISTLKNSRKLHLRLGKVRYRTYHIGMTTTDSQTTFAHAISNGNQTYGIFYNPEKWMKTIWCFVSNRLSVIAQPFFWKMNKNLWFSLSVLRVNKWIKAERECVFWYLFFINPNFRIFYSCPNTKIRSDQKIYFSAKN